MKGFFRTHEFHINVIEILQELVKKHRKNVGFRNYLMIKKRPYGLDML
jgi:hypothetical protein